MDDPADDRRGVDKSVSWRLKQAADDRRFGLDNHITFELADADGSVVTSFSIPAERMAALLEPHLQTFAELQLDGRIAVDTELSTSFQQPLQKHDVLQMVSDALAPQMIQGEPNMKEQLNELRRKLTEAIVLVDRTLLDLDNSAD